MILKEVLYSNLQTMTKDDYDKYLIEQEKGYIDIKSHPEDENIIILNYTQCTQFERRWNKETLSARGLILDITNININGFVYILAQPFGKFFNYGENPEYEKDINFEKIESVMEKMDGSLGISYYINDEIRIATRGSFTSEQALKATEILHTKYKSILDDMDIHAEIPITIMFEIIYPDNRIVVDYGGKEDLVLLAINEFDGLVDNYDWDIDDLTWFAEEYGFPIAQIYKYDIPEMIQMRTEIGANDEGWVIKFSNGKRLKIKGEEYLTVHRILCGLSDKAKVKAWSEGKMDEYIAMLPEEFRGELEDMRDALNAKAKSIFSLVRFKTQILKPSTKDRKSFALAVNDEIDNQGIRGLFFKEYEGRFTEQDVKDYILKNYKHYLEVINDGK